MPELSPERRAEVVQSAHERMETGKAQMTAALERMSAAAARDDFAAMQESTRQAREAVAIFESGVAARRALSEGRAPRGVALRWFKKEMNLAPPIPEEPRALLGVTPFHLFTMALLVAFALAMVAMYFFKMRRAAALFGRLDPDTNSPPPGSSPPPATPPSPATGTSAAAATSPGGSSVVPVSSGDAAKAADQPSSPPAAGSPPASPAPPPAVSEAAAVSPLTANWRGRLRVVSIVTETPSVKTIRLLPPSDHHFLPFTFVPGQFLNVAFGIGGARMNRSYSISSSPTVSEYVELTVRRESRGAVSRHIVDLLKVGDHVEAGGPVGRFIFTGTEADSIVLISSGVGITPMMSIARYLTERLWAGDIFFIYTCRTPADFIFADEVAALERRNPKLCVAVTISQAEGTDWKGHRGRITKEWLTQTIPRLASRRIHLCGPPAMMDAVKAILTELEIPPDQVKTEAFGTPRPAPAAAGTTAKPTAPATGPLVTFSQNNKSSKIRDGQTILELSEELDIGIEYSCRVGTCGVCKVKMTSGEVEMEVQDALDAEDKTNGFILACQAKPLSEVAVEA
ncbi:MAG: 2Fe-2S iron-sulfur cluster-binding protein [Acidobacteriota bacterium]|nr:2Fe-2S iron-sulfur cluster-binding protein [Acidobacteriota bacterium]